DEIRTLLRKAKEQGHPWYPIWVAAVFTGCRSGELLEIKRSDLELVGRDDAIKQDPLPFTQRRYGFIRIRRNWNARLKSVGPTKAGYWRTVPISSELYWFLVSELKVDQMKADDHILPHFSDWKSGYQAKYLRGFCETNGLPSIRFHALRACFATQLIAAGIPATIVMKIAGWKDMKTMQRYIRMAGIDEAGATEILRFIPTDEAVMEKIVSMVDFKREK
ncbi:MAG: site-specific integrase, partial [Bdellovibrionota bacterium]